MTDAMGLIVNRVRFEGVPPSEAEIRRELEARLGSSYGFDSLERKGSDIVIATDMGPLTEPYLLKILAERGGVLVDFATGEVRERTLPSFVGTPWRSLPIWTRARIRGLNLVGFMAAGFIALVTSFFRRK